MGQDHPVQRPAAHGQQLVRRVASGVPPAAAAAAVHQGKLRTGLQDHTLPLAHIHRRGIQPVAEPGFSGPDGDSQRQDTQRRCQRILPPSSGFQQPRGGKQEVYKSHPPFQIGAAEIDTVIRQGRQAVAHRQNIPDEQPGHQADDRPQGQPQKAQKHYRQSAGEHDTHRPEAQQIAEEGHHREAAEIVGTDGCRQGQAAHRGRNTGRCKGEQPAMFFLPCQSPVDPG